MKKFDPEIHMRGEALSERDSGLGEPSGERVRKGRASNVRVVCSIICVSNVFDALSAVSCVSNVFDALSAVSFVSNVFDALSSLSAVSFV